MFFQETTPDTSGYMIAGYIITFLIMGIYTASLYLRNRNYERDIALLEEMDQVEMKAQEKQTATTNKRTGKPSTKKSRQ